MARPLLPTLFPRPGANAGSLPALPRHPCVSLAPWPPLCPPGSWPWPPQPRGSRPPYTPFLPAHRPPVLGPHSHFQDRGRADSENWGGSSSAAERDLRGSSEALGAPHPTCSLQPCLLPLAGVWGAVGAACFSFGKGTQDAHVGTPARQGGGQLCQSTSRAPALPAMPGIVGGKAAPGVQGEQGGDEGLAPSQGRNQRPAPIPGTRPRSALSGLCGPGGGDQGPRSAPSRHPSPSDVHRLVSSDGTCPVPPPAEEAWGPQPSLCPSPDGLRPSLRHQPGPTQLPVCSPTCARVRACVRVRCRVVKLCPSPRLNK